MFLNTINIFKKLNVLNRKYEDIGFTFEILIIILLVILYTSGLTNYSDTISNIADLFTTIFIVFKFISYLSFKVFHKYSDLYKLSKYSTSKIFKLNLWIKTNLIFEPINKKVLQSLSTDKYINQFSEICDNHERDRFSFTINERINLYKHWLFINSKSFLGIKNKNGQIVATSIVIPLNEKGYQEFCYNNLESININGIHIDTGSAPRYLLIDNLIRNSNSFKEKPIDVKNIEGIAFRVLIYHLSFFIKCEENLPIILCSSANKKLINLLNILEFENSCLQNRKTPIYRIDLKHLDWYSNKIQLFYFQIIRLIGTYNKYSTLN